MDSATLQAIWLIINVAGLAFTVVVFATFILDAKSAWSADAIHNMILIQPTRHVAGRLLIQLAFTELSLVLLGRATAAATPATIYTWNFVVVMLFAALVLMLMSVLDFVDRVRLMEDARKRLSNNK